SFQKDQGEAVSLFYFNFRQGTSYSNDEEGCELPSVENAYLAAVRAAQDMWSELLVRREDPRACAFVVTDRDRKELFTLPFSEVLEACRREPSDGSSGQETDTSAVARPMPR